MKYYELYFRDEVTKAKTVCLAPDAELAVAQLVFKLCQSHTRWDNTQNMGLPEY